jgi:hypothetical protein
VDGCAAAAVLPAADVEDVLREAFLAIWRSATSTPARALAAAGASGAELTGGTLGVHRSVAGLTGIGLLCAAALSSSPAWTSSYLVIAVTPSTPSGRDTH